MNLKKNRKYQLRLFGTAFCCIWTVVLSFAWIIYRHEKKLRTENVLDRVVLTNSTIVDTHQLGGDIEPYLQFIQRYLKDTYLNDISIQIYDNRTRKLLYHIGKIHDAIPDDFDSNKRVALPDSSSIARVTDTTLGPHRLPLFLFSSRLTPDNEIDIRTYLPYSAELRKQLNISPLFWLIIIGMGTLGTILAFAVTAYQARNVTLLHDFAERAANDRDFIPMGDFPPDEIGEISRQIVAIYNSRMQANLRREREHAIALKATEEKNRLKRVLTNNINHELKTPIGIIRAYIDMLVRQPDMPEADRMHFLSKAQNNVERLVCMLNDLSTMTRLEESAGNIPLKELDFNELVFHLADELKESGILTGMDFHYNLPVNCMVLGNEGLLNSALNNLVKNAVAYSQGTEIGIDLISRNNCYFTFSFYDNGIGVSEEHIPHLFDRFYRIDSGRSRKSGGTGLGLPIVKSCINTMGGSVSVRRHKTGGLEFIFTLTRPKTASTQQ